MPHRGKMSVAIKMNVLSLLRRSKTQYLSLLTIQCFAPTGQ